MLFGFILQGLLNNQLLIYAMYGDDNASWIDFVVICFTFYSPFNYAKIFKDIGTYSGKHYDAKSVRWVKGSGYEYKYFFD